MLGQIDSVFLRMLPTDSNQVFLSVFHPSSGGSTPRSPHGCSRVSLPYRRSHTHCQKRQHLLQVSGKVQWSRPVSTDHLLISDVLSYCASRSLSSSLGLLISKPGRDFNLCREPVPFSALHCYSMLTEAFLSKRSLDININV